MAYDQNYNTLTHTYIIICIFSAHRFIVDIILNCIITSASENCSITDFTYSLWIECI